MSTRDAGGMTPEEKATLEPYMKRGGGLVNLHRDRRS
jgi:hypothetical protein